MNCVRGKKTILSSHGSQRQCDAWTVQIATTLDAGKFFSTATRVAQNVIESVNGETLNEIQSEVLESLKPSGSFIRGFQVIITRYLHFISK